MSLDASILRRLSALNLPSEAFQEVLSIMADAQEAEQDRRASGRKRTATWRDGKRHRDSHSDVTVTVTEASQERHSDSEHIYKNNLLTKKVSKKASISAPADAPEDASVENRTFAESKGWDARKTTSEWQRFRDHFIAKGKKHKNVDAAWRNWVTSPFQTPVAEIAKPSLVAQSGFYAAFSSPEMISWSNHERLIGKSYPRDKAGGWRFPSQWPPGLDPPPSALSDTWTRVMP